MAQNSSAFRTLERHALHPTALVIEPSIPRLQAVLAALSAIGFDATVADAYHAARDALLEERPALLVTAVKLGEYNGLQLVLRGTCAWPDLSAVVTSDEPDPVLYRETEALGATFVVMPAPQSEIVAAICRTVLTPRQSGKPVEPIRPPFERRTSGRRAYQPDAGAGDRLASERRKAVEEAIRSLHR